MYILEGEALYRAIVESFEGLVYVCDADYRLVYLNPQCRKQAGGNAVGAREILDFAFNLIFSQNLIATGSYPRIHQERLSAARFYSGYLQTYVERDVRTLINL